MYQEWMDGVPNFIEGCYTSNISQAKIAIRYYTKHNNTKMIDYYKQFIREQEIQRDKELNQPCKLKRIVDFIRNL